MRPRDAAEALARSRIRWIIDQYYKMPEARQRQFIADISDSLFAIGLRVHEPKPKPVVKPLPNLEDLI